MARTPWQALDSGPVIPGGSSVAYRTGSWRENRPVLELERCIHCLFCWLYCPDSAVLVRDGRVVGIDLDYCKGCGICAAVCPPKANAIRMVPEGTP